MSKVKSSNSLLYGIAAVFLIAWGIGYSVFNFGSVIHLLLVVAVVAVLIRIIRGA